ncbi:hypothetical protein [Sphingomonas sp. BAUL-RG-20F-R05-02]|uniref:hypothetical protein n=1 Tax=Sphingomonas sp. BAUL-RG-20F-R05-02 TaxID=2914830 RepID=UPI001F572710|nr:hypothetical protein [Sphingomonas sp. BAUL-RG-20F-R05-02]
MKACIPFALLAVIPALAHADPVATGPFYFRQDAAKTDQEEITTVIINAQKLTNGTIYLCSTSLSLPIGLKNQMAVRAGLTAAGVSRAMIRVGRRCGTALRHPPVSKAAQDAVVAIVGPSGR